MKNLLLISSLLCSFSALAVELDCSGTNVKLDESTLRMTTTRAGFVNDGYATRASFKPGDDRFVLTTGESLARQKTPYNGNVYSLKTMPTQGAVNCVQK